MCALVLTFVESEGELSPMATVGSEQTHSTQRSTHEHMSGRHYQHRPLNQLHSLTTAKQAIVAMLDE